MIIHLMKLFTKVSWIKDLGVLLNSPTFKSHFQDINPNHCYRNLGFIIQNSHDQKRRTLLSNQTFHQKQTAVAQQQSLKDNHITEDNLQVLLSHEEFSINSNFIYFYLSPYLLKIFVQVSSKVSCWYVSNWNHVNSKRSQYVLVH